VGRSASPPTSTSLPIASGLSANAARGYAQQVTARAQGEAAQFERIYAQYRLAPEVKLPEIIKAKKKPLETIEAAALGVTPRQRLQSLHYATPAGRTKGVMVKDVSELVAALAAKGLLS